MYYLDLLLVICDGFYHAIHQHYNTVWDNIFGTFPKHSTSKSSKIMVIIMIFVFLVLR